MIKNFLSWLIKRLRHLPPFQALRRALFESVSRSCQIRRNPQAIRTLKAIPPISPPSSQRPPASPRRSSATTPLNDPNNIVYTVPRADIVETLNHTLNHPPTQPIPHPEMGQFSRQETSSRPPYASERGGPLHPSRQNVERGPSSHSLDAPTNRSIDRLERSYADHPDILEELSDSAYLCECQRRYAEAEHLYKQVLTLKQRRLGSDHIELAITLNDLAALYCLRNQHEMALPLLHQALTIRQRHQVADHPELGDTFYQLAKVYRHQEQYGKAEPLFQQALSIFRQQFGGQHPRSQAVYNDLMQMIVTTIEGGQFSELTSELPPLDLNTLSDTYSWAKPSWQQSSQQQSSQQQ